MSAISQIATEKEERRMIATRPIRSRKTVRSKRKISRRRLRREEALNRLISLLQASSPEGQRPSQHQSGRPRGPLSQLARLRAAHAVYALSTGLMERTAEGAWIRINRLDEVMR